MSARQNEGRHRRGVGTLMTRLPLELAVVAVVAVVVAGKPVGTAWSTA